MRIEHRSVTAGGVPFDLPADAQRHIAKGRAWRLQACMYARGGVAGV
jgi:hypothetical protein